MLIYIFVFLVASVTVNANESPWYDGDDDPGSISSASATAFSSASGGSATSSAYAASYSSVSAPDCDDDKYKYCKNRNATYKRCPNPCPGTCQNPQGVKNCYKACEIGCECNPGYVLSENGRCLLLKDCPDYLRCNGDRNATFKECPSACPRTCEYPGGRVCTAQCLKEGCECKDGYYLDTNGKCVQLQDCSAAKKCSSNETFVFCYFGCPTNDCPKNDGLGIIACSPPYPCRSGCSCKADYLRNADGRCIKATDCSPINCTRPNEEWNPCIPPCPFNRCSDIGKPQECNRAYPYCRPQCTCKKGYYYNDNNVCVPKDKCPIKCGYNEVAVKCKTTCPPQNCKVTCPEFGCYPEGQSCEPGCDCLPNHLRNASGICVPQNQCPPRPKLPKCGYNEKPTYCKVECPPQDCESIFTTYLCNNTDYKAINVGCDCLWGYLRNASGICVPSEDCFPRCSISEECRPTCANPTPKNCPPRETVTDNEDGCKCKPGYILNEPDGKCIRIEECPTDKGCNGDLNSTIVQCPWPCPATCDSPTAGTDGKKCEEVGCQCKSGYILNRKGKCVLPDQCKGGNPCGVNGTFSDCGFRCPNQNCPDDSGLQIACKPGRPCPPGCLCNEGYKRDENDNCILESDCPGGCKINLKCRPTCAQPKPPNCDYVPPSDTNIDGCTCQLGYILSEPGGKCIKIEECPTDIGCNNDPNARIKQEPLPCPSTCKAPNAVNCKRKPDPVGCECKPGYLLSQVNGKCILPDDCKGGNPCGPNATFVPCKSGCATDYCPVDDSRARVICETYPFSPCFPGCVCKLNHKILSRDDKRCIISSECPPVNCTRPNECWDSCPEECSSGYCEEVDQPKVICNTLVLNCNPGCVCKDGFLRNPADDRCVSAQKCRKINEKKIVYQN